MSLIASTFSPIDGFKLIFQTWDTALLVAGTFLICIVFFAGIILFLYEREYRAKINYRDSKIENLESVIKSLEERLKNREEKLERLVDDRENLIEDNDKVFQNESKRHEEEIARVEESYRLELKTLKETKDKEYRDTYTRLSNQLTRLSSQLSSKDKELGEFRGRIAFLAEKSSYFSLMEYELRGKVQKLVDDVKLFSVEQNRKIRSLPPLDNSISSLSKPVSFFGSAPTEEEKIRKQQQDISLFISKEFKKRFQSDIILLREVIIAKLKTKQKV
jgi:chromosome segregation ATPase